MRQLDYTAIKNADPQSMFSTAETARMLGMTLSGVRMMASRGKIKYIRRGSRYYFPAAELQSKIEVPEESQTTGANVNEGPFEL